METSWYPGTARHLRGDQLGRVRDISVGHPQLGADGQAFGPVDRGRVGGHGDEAGQPRAGGIGRPGRTGVSVGRHGHSRDAQFGGTGHPDGGTAGLEGSGGDEALILHQQAGRPQRTAQARHRQQRRHAFTQAYRPAGAGDRQQFVVTPQVRRAAADFRAVCQFGGPGEVVPREQRRAALTQTLHDGGVMDGAAPGALQMGKGRIGPGHHAFLLHVAERACAPAGPLPAGTGHWDSIARA